MTYKGNYNQVAYKKRDLNTNTEYIIAYQFQPEEKVIKVSTGETLTQSANAYIAKTNRGRKNLKVAKLSKSNWKKAAQAHAENIVGCYKGIDTLVAESLDFENLPELENLGETIYQVIDKWSKNKR